MCGIAAVIGLENRPLEPPDESALRAMASQLRHRGPDETRYVVTDSVALAFQRLSIVDLASGSQPIAGENEGVIAVVNGEIYNHAEVRAALRGVHQFKSRSD